MIEYGYIYVVKDETGIKIGSSKENCINDRINSVMRNRGTGTCELVGISKKYLNYRTKEKGCRKRALLKYNLPLPINEWHNFKYEEKDKITSELLQNIMNIINSCTEYIPKL